MNKYFFSKLQSLLLVLALLCCFDSIASNNQALSVQEVVGDVNGDGSVTIKDVTVLIDLLLSDGTMTEGADVNGDGDVTIKDVTMLIDMLLEGSSGGEEPTALEAPSILVLGNSFTLDSWLYVPFLLKDYGINIKLGIYYLAGGSLPSTVAGYEKGTLPAWYNRGFYYINTANDTTWTVKIPRTAVTMDSVDYCFPTPRQCVQYYEGMESELAEVLADTVGEFDDRTGKLWDIIVLQQVSTGSVLWTSYMNYNTSVHYAKTIRDLIDGDMRHDYDLGWNIIHSKSGNDSDWPTDILANIKDACSQPETNTTTTIDVVFPYGTAIFNARNDSTLKNLGYNGYTDLWVDGQHLAGGLPHYLASLAIVEQIFRQYFPDSGLSVQGNSVVPDADWLKNKWMPSGRATMVVGATAENCALAQQAAIKACDDPWSIYGGWPITIRIKCNDNCYIDSAPEAYGIESGATDVSFQVPAGTTISDIVIKTKEGYELYDNYGNTQAYYRHKRLDGVSVYYANQNESLGTEFTAVIPAEEVTSNIEMFFNAKAR